MCLMSGVKSVGVKFHRFAQVLEKKHQIVSAGIEMKLMLDLFLFKFLMQCGGSTIKAIVVFGPAIEINPQC